MNKIFKVIYSKVRNCYVVTSEFAKANTKSSTGSAKSKTGKKALLTLAVASAIMCGGWMNVGAANTVHVDESSNTTYQEVYTKDGADKAFATKDALATKADATTVTTNTTNIETNKNNIQSLQNDKLDKTTAEETYAKKTDVAKNTANIANNTTEIAKKIDRDLADATYAKSSDVYTQAQVDQKVTEALTTAGTNVDTKLADYAKTANVDTKLNAKADKSTTLAGYGITDSYTKGEVDTKLGEKADKSTTLAGYGITDAYTKEQTDDKLAQKANASDVYTKGDIDTKMGNVYTKTEVEEKLADEVNARNTAITNAIHNESEDRTNAINAAINGEVTERNKAINDAINLEVTNRDAAITNAKNELQGKITAEETARKEADNKLEEKITANTTAINNEAIARVAEDTALSNRIGTVDADGKYIKKSDTNNISKNLKVLDSQVDTNAANIKANADAIAKEKSDREAKDTELDGKITSTDAKLTQEIQYRKDADAAINTKIGTIDDTRTTYVKDGQSISQNLTKLDEELVETNGRTAGIERDAANERTIVKDDLTVKKDLTVEGTIHADKITFGSETNNQTTIDKGTISSKNDKVQTDGTSKKSSLKFDESKFEVGVSDKDSNGHLIMDADKTQLTNRDLAGKNLSDIVADKDKIKTSVKDENGNVSSMKESASEINHYVEDKDKNWSTNHQDSTSASTTISNKDGTQSTKTEQTTTDIINTAKSGTIKNDAKDIVNSASGNIKNSSATMDTTVTGKATESYGELETTIKGNETHNVDGNQTSTIKGTQTTTVEGDVTEDYKKNLTTKVGGDELHEVTGKVTENFKGGQETNVTGDQTTTVSGTQTTNATDINRNASSGMIDKVDNAYGTNTETKVAGKTTTEVTIKGTCEKGEYIRGANEAKDTLTKGTLKNSETKTVEATFTEITDGSGNTSSTIQDKGQISGSVTNGTDKAVSNVKADSIDSAVIGAGSSSVINQKKDSITSSVGNDTTSTVIQQGEKDITIASNGGTVAISGKDIINNASGNMTNIVGDDLTTTVTGKTVEDYKGGLTTTVTGDESHTVTGNQTNEVGGNQTNTINGNQTTTVTGDISNSAKNITNEASEKLTDKVEDNTRVLDREGITDTVGNTSFKQRIDDIMMEAKNGTITSDAKNIMNKATETITNDAVDITNNATGTISSNASEIKNQADKLISNKVGENTYQNIEDGKITESIKNGTKQNLTQSDADKTEHSVVDGVNASVTRQTSTTIEEAVTDGTNTNASLKNASMSAETITNGTQANTVASTANGTTFTNSDASTALTEGGATNTTIKGNTITTGKVTMDYADVMKDLGVRGNANIAGKTTTGELEVTGKSTLKGDVTMESNATVKKDLTVDGNATVKKDFTVDGTTTTKDLSVTNNATIGGTLDVTGKATFKDSVDVAKDLNVGGNATITGDVTANSYKVGGKTYIDANGINANNQVISNVADGTIAEGSMDAVNGGQLFETNRRIDQFDSRINEVGANAAAMANLHPMEFDADSKLNVAVGVGNYRNKTATAMGLFYRPNEDVMFNVSSTIGSSDNMIGGGVSFRLGSGGNKLKNKAFADAAEQNKQLKSQVDTLQAQMDALLSVINPNMSKDFPDVPDNHWAYEAVSRLAGNDIIQGYEDGKYHGERTMTRYEMAVIIYKALQKGAKAEAKLVEEFKPELKAIAAHEKA